jgi:histidinol-phosphate aminotransferase
METGRTSRKRAKAVIGAATLVADWPALGFDVLPSAANFIFARHPRHDAASWPPRCASAAIIVRHFKLPRIDQYRPA